MSPRPAHNSARLTGFTLLELMAVLVIIAILSGAVVLTMAGRLRSARMADVVAKLQDLDRWTRYDARRFARPANLAFDFERGVACRDAGQRSRIVTLPPGYSLVGLRDSRGMFRGGETQIECSADGRTNSYALAIAGPDHSEAWIVFAGLTGERTLAKDEAEVDAIFASLNPAIAEVR